MKLFVIASVLAGAALAQQASPDSAKTASIGAAPGNLPRFEVASLKLAPPSNSPGMAAAQDMLQNYMPAGFIQMDRARVTMRNRSLLNLVAAAYRVRPSRISGPAWMAEQRFDVDAKIPEDAPPGQVNEMLQALLAERFALKLHSESKSQAGYALVVGKNGPKLQVAVPYADHPNAAGSDDDRKEAPLPMMLQAMKDRQAQGKAGWTSWQFRSITTARLAEAISSYAEVPVTDVTGLDGKYAVVLESLPPHTDPASGLEDPGVTIFECVAKLGLKLEPRKVIVETIVVDSATKMPTAN